MRSIEGVGPAEALEAGEVGIGGADFAAVLDGEGGEMGVVREVSGSAKRLKQASKDCRVPICGVNHDDRR